MGFAGSLSDGGAKMTAVLDMTALDAAGVACAVVTAAPTGRRTAGALGFWAAVRRTGANARLADHPGDHDSTCGISMNDDFVNKRALHRQCCRRGRDTGCSLH